MAVQIELKRMSENYRLAKCILGDTREEAMDVVLKLNGQQLSYISATSRS